MPLSARMPDLRAFEVLLAIARTGSLGGTGRELGLSQQTVSARLAALETLTGVRLVARTTRGSQLTPTGVVVAEWAGQLLGVAERVDAGFATLRQESKAKIRIAASNTIAEQLLPQWLVSLQSSSSRRGASSPDVVLSTMNSQGVIDAVAAHDADVGFIEGPRLPKGLHYKIVGTDELVVVVPPNHKWARRSNPISAAELIATPMVLREPGSGTRECLRYALRHSLGGAADVAPPVIELSSVAAIRAAVIAGAGPAVVSRLSAADDLALGRLKVVQVAELDMRRVWRAVWSGSRTPPAGGVRDLLSHIGRHRGTLTPEP